VDPSAEDNEAIRKASYYGWDEIVRGTYSKRGLYWRYSHS
jgi:hypothetical protein